MTTFNTGNPLDSADPRDLYDNSQVIDQYATSLALTTTDRLNRTRLTHAGLEARAATGAYTVRTLAQLNAITPPPGTNPAGRVTADGVNTGYYVWENGAWEMTDDPLEKIADTNSSFVQGVREGVTSEPPSEFLKFVRAVSVQGMKKGQIFKIEYFQNQNTGFMPPIDAFIFSVFEDKNFNGRMQINNRKQAEVTLDRTATKQVVQFEFLGLTISLLLNPSELPPIGTAMFSNFVENPGYSWYTGEVGYVYEGAPEFELSPFFDFYDTESLLIVDANDVPVDLSGSQMEVISYSPFFNYGDVISYEEYDKSGHSLIGSGVTPTPINDFGKVGETFVDYIHAEKSLGVSWMHNETTMYKTIWKPNGFNKVFNFYQHLYAPIGDPDVAAWTIHQTSITDYIPPITHLATTGVTSTNVTTTGGNHQGANGEFTGFLQQCDFYVNKWPMVSDTKGYFDASLVRWRNGLCSGNTVTQQRITTQQDFVALFTARNVEVLSQVEALEPIEVVREGGTQMVFSGWEDRGFHFYGGVNQGPVQYLAKNNTMSAAIRTNTSVDGTATNGNTIRVARAGVTLGTVVVAAGAFNVTLSPALVDNDNIVVTEENGATIVSTVNLENIRNSGPKSAAPDVWANVVKNNTLGYFAAWIDRDFGIGRDGVKDYNFMSTRNLTKLYNFSIAFDRTSGGTEPFYQMATGDKYKWRGGYSYAPLDIVDGLDSAFTFTQNGKLRLAVANSAGALSGSVKLPLDYLSADFETIGAIDSFGNPIEFTGYSATFYKELN